MADTALLTNEPGMPVETKHAAARRYSFAGAALIFFAFVAPLMATAFGLGSAYTVGQDLARTLGSLFGLAVVTWLVMRNRSDLAKAKARLVVGLLLCLTVANNIANTARENSVAKDFMRGAIAFQAKHASKFEDLGKRFEENTVNQYVTPAALTSAQSIAAGQAALERYRSLLQERNLLLQTYMAEYRAYVNSVPEGEARRGAEASMGPAMDSANNLYKTLDVAQRAHADALGAVFAWAQTNVGKLSNRGGQLVFQSAQQQSELNALAQRLQAAENVVDEATKFAQAEQVKAAAKRDTAMKEAEALLGK